MEKNRNGQKTSQRKLKKLELTNNEEQIEKIEKNSQHDKKKEKNPVEEDEKHKLKIFFGMRVMIYVTAPYFIRSH